MTMRTHFTSSSSAIMRLSCSSLLATLFGLVTLLVFPVAASAQTLHAEYVSSDPAANAVLTKAPSTITIHFSEELDPKSTILVYDVDHQLVSQQGSAQVDHQDLKTMTIALQPNKSELYVVDWQTIAADDQHHDAGSFRFFVNPDPMLTAELHTNTTSGQTTTSSGGLPIWSAALIGVVALLVGGLAGVFFGGKRLQKK
jgi:methionine-rich copper-binding protein CopC